MATLVLTPVGGAIGGPIGAALGGLIGQAVDRDVLFRPKGHEGPRLSELRVQTSSYGTPLPRLFGTMRVAGSVIWSTDLIESRATSHAKGQPSVTTYSYAASFAVALSARRVVGIGRVWADGKLLRGAAGDWKSSLGAFRLHLGDEDQAVDPLLASAEGDCPAQRGTAYVVFEQLQLADFGNRIPSLSFELIADAAAPTIGAIATEIGGGRVRDGGVAMTLGGFSAYGGAREVLDVLAQASGGWWAPVGDALELRTDADAIATVDDAGVAAKGAGERRARKLPAADTVPRIVTVTHYDPARDWQAGVQRARRPGAGEGEMRIELPAALDAGAAKAVAEAALTRAEAERGTRRVTTGLAALRVAPGDAVRVAGEAGTWRVVDTTLEAMTVALTLVPLVPAPMPVLASAGRVLRAPDLLAGRTLLEVAELPPLGDTLLDQPRVTVFAAGTQAGWRRAALLWSTDGGERWTEAGSTAAPATMGTLITALPAGSAALFDEVTVVEVELAHAAMALAGADDRALDAGANVALVGDELIQFGRAVQLSETRWRLARLLRGRRGSATGAASGSRFVTVAADAAVMIDPGVAAIGGEIRVMATGVGDGDAAAVASAPVTGASVRPPAPVALMLADGTARLTWTRRSRVGWRWIDGADAPLGEEAERYRVTVNGEDRVVELPEAMLSAADLAGGAIAVRQLGTHGESPATVLMVGE